MRYVGTLASVFALLALAFNAVLYTARAYWRWTHPSHDTDEPLGLLDAAWAFIKECGASAVVVFLIPVGWLLPPCRTGSGTRGPLVLVAGGGLTRGALWLVRRRLLRDGWSPVCCLEHATPVSSSHVEHRTPNTEHRNLSDPSTSQSVPGARSSVFRAIFRQTRNADIERTAEQLRATVVRLAEAAPRQPITLVGHGRGGIVLRYYARRYPTPHVRRLVTLGTPHFGTLLATLAPMGPGRLDPGSRVLHTLNAADRVPLQFDAIAIHSSFDAFILPPANAEYPGAFNVRVHDVGHHMLLFSAKVYNLLRENLEAPLAQGQG